MKRVLLLLVDGLRPDLAESMLAAGELPELEAMTRNGGVARAITAFPSTTSVAYLPFLTGCTPGRCNVPSIRWLDRSTYRGRWWRDRNAIRSYCGYQAVHLDRDIAPEAPSIFELVPDSVGIFTPVARGLTPARDPSRFERKFWGSVTHYTLHHQPSDNAAARHLLSALEGPWRFIFAQFPAVDGYSHQTGPSAAPVRGALRRFDQTMGRVRQRLEQRGELDDTLILMVSDHGSASVHTHLDLPDWFRAHGVPTLSHPIVWEPAPRAAVMVAGNASAMVYAQPNSPRAHRWPLDRLRAPESFGTDRDLVEALIKEDAVALVAGESGDGGVRVASKDGEADLTRVGSALRYAPRSGDPLSLGGARTATHRDWLHETWDGPFPDAPYQLLDQFRASRTGDLLAIANEGYDFRRRYEMPEHKSGHGSLIRAHMQVPLWSSQPVPAAPLRTIDLLPAMLDWLGEPVPEGIDGCRAWSPAGERVEALTASTEY
ncbi:MAG: alkaline phosphatase family protein [Gemmatimonadales bacterium]